MNSLFQPVTIQIKPLSKSNMATLHSSGMIKHGRHQSTLTYKTRERKKEERSSSIALFYTTIHYSQLPVLASTMIFANIRFYDTAGWVDETRHSCLSRFILRGNSSFLPRGIRQYPIPKVLSPGNRGGDRIARIDTYLVARISRSGRARNAITTHNEVNSGGWSYVLVIRKGWNERWRCCRYTRGKLRTLSWRTVETPESERCTKRVFFFYYVKKLFILYILYYVGAFAVCNYNTCKNTVLTLLS